MGANLGAELKARKGPSRTRSLDVEVNTVGLSSNEWIHRYALEASLMEICKGEELFWRHLGGHN